MRWSKSKPMLFGLCLQLMFITIFMIGGGAKAADNNNATDGFIIQADRVVGTGMNATIVQQETSAKSGKEPMLRIQYQSATIYGMRLIKQVESSSGMVSISLKAQGPVTVKGMTVDTTAISFKGACLVASETVPNVAMENVTMVAHYMDNQSSNINQLDLNTVAGETVAEMPNEIQLLTDLSSLSPDQMNAEIQKISSGHMPLTCQDPSKTGGTTSEAGKVTDPLKVALGGVVSPLVPVASTLNPVLASLNPLLNPVLNPVLTSLNPVLDPVLSPLDPVLNQFGPILGQLNPILSQAGPIMGLLNPVLNQAGPVINQLDPIVNGAGSVINQLSPALKPAEPIVNQVSQTAGQVTSKVSQAAGQTTTQVSQAAGQTTTQVSQAAGQTTTQASQAAGQTTPQVSQAAGQVTTQASQTVSQATNQAPAAPAPAPSQPPQPASSPTGGSTSTPLQLLQTACTQIKDAQGVITKELALNLINQTMANKLTIPTACQSDPALTQELTAWQKNQLKSMGLLDLLGNPLPMDPMLLLQKMKDTISLLPQGTVLYKP